MKPSKHNNQFGKQRIRPAVNSFNPEFVVVKDEE